MQKNLDRLGGLVHSQRVLIALTQKGVRARGRLPPRAAQRHAGVGRRRRFPGAAQGRQGRARKYLSDKELEANFDLDHHFKHVDTIFRRVFGA